MNGFLVLLVHTMDDLPVGLWKTKEMAVDHAKLVNEMPDAHIRKVFGTDCSTPVCVKVVEFSAGRPVAVVFNRDFDAKEYTGN